MDKVQHKIVYCLNVIQNFCLGYWSCEFFCLKIQIKNVVYQKNLQKYTLYRVYNSTFFECSIKFLSQLLKKL